VNTERNTGTTTIPHSYTLSTGYITQPVTKWWGSNCIPCRFGS